MNQFDKNEKRHHSKTCGKDTNISHAKNNSVSNSDKISQCESSLSADLEESGESCDFIHDNTDETNVSDSNQYLLSLFYKNRKFLKECENSTVLHHINTVLLYMDKTTETPELKTYTSAYGSCKFYKVDNGARIVPISYPHLYQYRAVELNNFNRLKYYKKISLILLLKNHPSHNTNLDKTSKTYKLDKGVEIWANHHQTLHSEQCIHSRVFRNHLHIQGKSLMMMKQILTYLCNGTRRQSD